MLAMCIAVQIASHTDCDSACPQRPREGAGACHFFSFHLICSFDITTETSHLSIVELAGTQAQQAAVHVKAWLHHA